MSTPVSPGLGGAVGYMLGGLDWTGTALGRAFKSQEQVLFLFAGIIFIISVTLHMVSIPERPFAPSRQLKTTGSRESNSQLSFRPAGDTPPLLDVIPEEDAFAATEESDTEEGEMDFLAVERVRSKSDSVLAMPDATIELDSDLNLTPDSQLFLPDFLPATQAEDVFKSSVNGNPDRPPVLTDEMVGFEHRSPTSAELQDPTDHLLPDSEDSCLKTQVM